MALFESAEGDDTLYPDGLITEAALEEMSALAEGAEPFLLAVGLIRPHLPFGAPAQYMSRYEGVALPPTRHTEKPLDGKGWHPSGEFMKYQRWGKDPREDEAFAAEVRRHYAACVSYVDAQVERLLDQLDALALSDDTVVVLWGDHGFHLGEHAIWGKHALFEESLHSPLIIRQPGMPHPGAPCWAVVETIDLYPTLCAVSGLPTPERVEGADLSPQLRSPGLLSSKGSVSYRQGRTLRTPTHRLTVYPDGSTQLFDHRTWAQETQDVSAEQPQVLEAMLRTLNQRLPEVRQAD